MGNKTDMTLEVTVLVNGSVDQNGNASINAQYFQGQTVPASIGVVANNGYVDLRNMAYDPNLYDVDTDITFVLGGRIVDQNNNALEFSFPQRASDAVTITRQDGGPTNKLRARSGANQWQVCINDDDNDDSTYNYCLAIEIDTHGRGKTTVRLDPQIRNRPV